MKAARITSSDVTTLETVRESEQLHTRHAHSVISPAQENTRETILYPQRHSYHARISRVHLLPVYERRGHDPAPQLPQRPQGACRNFLVQEAVQCQLVHSLWAVMCTHA